MFQKLLKLLDKIYPAEIVYAHCDVPCGIYETGSMLTAAETMGKMVEKMLALEYPGDDAEKEPWLAYKNSLVRMILEKEEQGEICKKELLILWTDYFKPEHLKMFPNLHETFWQAAKLASKNKQNVSLEAVLELKSALRKIDGMFKAAEASKK
ncbi:MAG: superoxide dismutase, Ni [bacterium]|nr:superoxide dismutase, Ni [bacterium]